MDETQSINTQTAAPVTPTSTGPNVDELQTRLAELERQSEGRLRDLQNERQKRQELEQRLVTPHVTAPQVEEDEVGKLIKPYVAPAHAAAQEARKMMDEIYHEKAWDFLTSKTGKTRVQIEADSEFQNKLTQVVRKYNLQGNIKEVTEKAYELLELLDVKAKEQERVRSASIGNSQPLAGGNPPILTSAKQYTAEEFDRLPPAEYTKLSRDGNFKKVDGRFVYTPR